MEHDTEEQLMNAKQVLRYLKWDHLKAQTLYLHAKQGKAPHHLNEASVRNKYLFKARELRAHYKIKSIEPDSTPPQKIDWSTDFTEVNPELN